MDSKRVANATDEAQPISPEQWDGLTQTDGWPTRPSKDYRLERIAGLAMDMDHARRVDNCMSALLRVRADTMQPLNSLVQLGCLRDGPAKAIGFPPPTFLPTWAWENRA